jgi:hypothetical protein
LIRHRQVFLPRLNHDVTSDGIEFAKVCYADKPDMERNAFNPGEVALTNSQPRSL